MNFKKINKKKYQKLLIKWNWMNYNRLKPVLKNKLKFILLKKGKII